MASDPKPPPRRRDPELFKLLHADPNKACCLCEEPQDVQLHHVLPRAKGGDDVRENLVFLDHACHHRVTLNYPDTREALGVHLVMARPDVIAYVKQKLGDEAGSDWLARRLFVLTLSARYDISTP